MGHRVRIPCQSESKRLLLIIGLMFAVLLAFQYLEVPYVDFLSSFYPSGKVSVLEKFLGASSTKSGIAENINQSNDFNSTDLDKDHGRANVTESPKNETDSGLRNQTVSERERDSHDIMGFTNRTWTSGNSTSSDGRSSLPNAGQLKNGGHGAPSPAFSPMVSSTNIVSSAVPDSHLTAPVVSINPGPSSVGKGTEHGVDKPKRCSALDDSPLHTAEVVSIFEMNELLPQSRASSCALRPLWSLPVDQELQNAKSLIENAPIFEDDTELYGPLFWNVSMFKRSYELMERTLKVYIYGEGPKPVFHQPPLTGIYASEGWFMKLMESNKQFVTKNPSEAHLFYLPFSPRVLEKTLYDRHSNGFDNLIQYINDYLDLIVAKYPNWNRTDGSDHFLVGCHDWTPAVTRRHMGRCIKAMCNADLKEGFKFPKDVSLPETLIYTAKDPLRHLGGKPAAERDILAFFAGRMHGYLRPVLLKYWGNKDPDMRVLGRMPRVRGNINYIQSMRSSRYCICPRGYEVNSPRVVEAIFYECVPVIISDNFVPPLFEVLDWEKFAVFVMEKDVPNLKNILLSIPWERYLEMQERVKKVQRHFLWHKSPVKFDLFHMILHSIWYKRVFLSPPL